MQIELKEALVQYARLLREQGVGTVKLDRRSRTFLRQLKEGTSVPAAPNISRQPESQAEQPKPQPEVSPVARKEEPTENLVVAGRSKAEQLLALRERALVCQKCAHLASFRQQVVFGVGNPAAELMFVGEAPGADEDRLGEPFVGRAGELLTKMIVAMGLTRDQVYIANILKCRPDMPAGAPGNRKPTPEEMQTCSPYLTAQIEIIRPKVMVGLGASAMEGLLGNKGTISRLRGHFQEFRGIPLMPTFHPSYLLHNSTLETKRQVWEDLLQVMASLKMPISEKQRGFFR